MERDDVAAAEAPGTSTRSGPIRTTMGPGRFVAPYLPTVAGPVIGVSL
jgi:hypothetical protein